MCGWERGLFVCVRVCVCVCARAATAKSPPTLVDAVRGWRASEPPAPSGARRRLPARPYACVRRSRHRMCPAPATASLHPCSRLTIAAGARAPSARQNSHDPTQHPRLRPRPGPHPPPGPPQTTEIRLTETAPAPAPHDGVHIRRIRISCRRIRERVPPPRLRSVPRRFCGSRPCDARFSTSSLLGLPSSLLGFFAYSAMHFQHCKKRSCKRYLESQNGGNSKASVD